MLNKTLFWRETRGSLKSLLIFGGLLVMYFAVIVSMFDPELEKMLSEFAKAMPEVMAMFGMASAASSMIGFLASYIYGFLMPVVPMVFTMMCANRLISRHVDRGSMSYLLAAPVKRSAVVLTQMFSLLACVTVLVVFAAAFGFLCCEISFPGELDIKRYMLINAGVLCLQLFIAGVCFFCSCVFGDTKHSLAFGAGIPAVSYIIQMAANAGPSLEKLKYFTFFSLYRAETIAAGESGAMLGSVVLLVCAVALFAASAIAFCKKDMFI